MAGEGGENHPAAGGMKAQYHKKKQRAQALGGFCARCFMEAIGQSFSQSASVLNARIISPKPRSSAMRANEAADSVPEPDLAGP